MRGQSNLNPKDVKRVLELTRNKTKNTSFFINPDLWKLFMDTVKSNGDTGAGNEHSCSVAHQRSLFDFRPNHDAWCVTQA